MSAQIVEIHNEPTRLAVARGGRELATRDDDGLRVQLLWDPIANAVTVQVEDLRAGNSFHLAVARERALDAFYHPFAYAA
jgi:hypothetical protein